MQTIELVGEKSVVKFDVEEVPRTAFILFQGRAYHTDEPGGLLWHILEGMPPDGASLTYFEDGKFVEAIDEAAPTTTETAPVVELSPPTPGLAANAESDHTKTV